MPPNPLFQDDPGTLDEALIRSGKSRDRLGWRWLLSCVYLLLLAGLMAVVVWPADVTASDAITLSSFVQFPDALFVLVPLLGSCLLFFRTQIGWVLGTILVSAMIVLSALGFIAQFMPSIEPVNHLRGARMLTSSISLILACAVFYLLSHPTLRAAFRIPNSWIQRCITLGGLLGTGLGIWLLYLTGLFTRL